MGYLIDTNVLSEMRKGERANAGVREWSAGRLLIVTPGIADRWGRLNIPDPLPVIDSLLAATALEYGLTLVTRNIKEVERTGASLLNPFSP